MKNKFLLFLMSAAVVLSAVAEAEKKSEGTNGVAKVDYSAALGNAWLKCLTDKEPVSYAVGEDIKFTFSLEGVTNAIPAGLLKLKFTRTGVDGLEEASEAPLDKKSAEFTTKLTQPGFLRLVAVVTDKDGKPFMGTTGKHKRIISCECGAGAELDAIKPPTLTKDFPKRVKEIEHKVARVNFKKAARAGVEAPELKAHKAYAVTIPSETEPQTFGLLVLPAELGKDAKLRCRLCFASCGAATTPKAPDPKTLSSDEAVFTLAFDFKEKDTRDDAFCVDLLQRSLCALAYLKSLPEWNGKGIAVEGYEYASIPALWTAACGKGVQSVKCALLDDGAPGDFAPSAIAQLIPVVCRVDITLAGLGDDKYLPADVARIWNAMTCEKSLLWMQGGVGWSVPKGYIGRHFLWEKLSPVAYRNMDVEHAVPFGNSQTLAFKDPDFSFRDTIVVEALIDIDKPDSYPGGAVKELHNHAQSDLIPVALYASIPKKRIKDKQWNKFMEEQGKLGITGFTYPVYFDAGMELPEPPSLPWFHVTDSSGVLRYSGAKADEAQAAMKRIFHAMPPYDRMFMYEKPKLLKADIDKMVKAKLPLFKIYKAIDTKRKQAKPDSPVGKEAHELTIGMRQAVARRIQNIKKEFDERPGLGYGNLVALAKEWPECEAEPAIKSLRARVDASPDIPKLMKLEAELKHLVEWNPKKTADIKKKEKQETELRKKLDRFAKSKDALTQGEAMAMTMELDNPPQPQPQDQQ